MFGSKIIIAEEDRLRNVHPGDILREDFLVGSEISIAEVAAGAGVDANRLSAIVDGRVSVDADVNLRLARYFEMNDGFFLGLQADYDLEEAWRAHGPEIERIVPRAA